MINMMKNNLDSSQLNNQDADDNVHVMDVDHDSEQAIPNQSQEAVNHTGDDPRFISDFFSSLLEDEDYYEDDNEDEEQYSYPHLKHDYDTVKVF